MAGTAAGLLGPAKPASRAGESSDYDLNYDLNYARTTVGSVALHLPVRAIVESL